MTARGSAMLAALLASALVASPARAECYERAAPRWSVHQLLILLLNPMGAEHTVRVGLCLPLYGSDDDAFADNHLEVGVTAYNSPIYALGGGYVQLGPASFLFVRAELLATAIWSLPLPGAGYFARTGYDDGFRQQDLPERGGEATGWTARLSAVLRGEVDLAPGVSLLAMSSTWLDYFEIGTAPFWVDVRDDAIAARADWVFAHEGVLVMSAIVPAGPELRFGAYSALRVVPASGYVGHQVGPLAMIAFPNPDPFVASIDIFVRLGIYTHHAFRERQLTTMAGVAVDWDLGGI